MAQTPEAKVKKSIKDWLKSQGFFYFLPAGTAYGTVGVSDIIVCVKGMFVAIEVKAPGKINNTTANQDKFIDNVIKSGGIAFAADSLDVVLEVFKLHRLV